MPPLSMLKSKYVLEPSDFPPNRPVCVVIERFDSEEKEGNDGEPYTRHLIYLVGYRYPLALNNGKIDSMAEALGVENTEECIGKKIFLQVMKDTIYGQSKWVIKILAERADAAVPAEVPYKIASNKMTDQQTAEYYGVKLLPMEPRTPAHFRLSGQAATPPGPAPIISGETIGLINALKISEALFRRNRTQAEAEGWVADLAPQLAKLVRGAPLTLWPKESVPFISAKLKDMPATLAVDELRRAELENKLKQEEADFQKDLRSLDLPIDDDIPI